MEQTMARLQQEITQEETTGTLKLHISALFRERKEDRKEERSFHHENAQGPCY
jgi:hypothetical protein